MIWQVKRLQGWQVTYALTFQVTRASAWPESWRQRTTAWRSRTLAWQGGQEHFRFANTSVLTQHLGPSLHHICCAGSLGKHLLTSPAAVTKEYRWRRTLFDLLPRNTYDKIWMYRLIAWTFLGQIIELIWVDRYTSFEAYKVFSKI